MALEAVNVVREIGDRPMTDRGEIITRSWNDTRSLTVQRSYLVDGLFAENELGQTFAPAGYGKTTVEMQACQAIGSGRRLWGRKTKQTHCIIIDAENSLTTLVERTRSLGEAQNVEFWDRSSPTPPPKLDGSDGANWETYFNLPQRSMLWFDTIRCFHNGDDTDSKKVSLVMDRLKALCAAGYTVVFVNHSPKGNKDTFKGPSTYIDQSDYCLSLTRVKKRGKVSMMDTEDEDGEINSKGIYRLGMYQKSRIPALYNAEILLRFNPTILGFEPLEADTDRELEALEEMLATFGPMKSGEFIKRAKDELGLSDRRGPELLQTGITRNLWKIEPGPNNSKVYTLSQSSQFADTNTPMNRGVYGVKTAQIVGLSVKTGVNERQNRVTIGFQRDQSNVVEMQEPRQNRATIGLDENKTSAKTDPSYTDKGINIGFLQDSDDSAETQKPDDSESFDDLWGRLEAQKMQGDYWSAIGALVNYRPSKGQRADA